MSGKRKQRSKNKKYEKRRSKVTDIQEQIQRWAYTGPEGREELSNWWRNKRKSL